MTESVRVMRLLGVVLILHKTNCFLEGLLVGSQRPIVNESSLHPHNIFSTHPGFEPSTPRAVILSRYGEITFVTSFSSRFHRDNHHQHLTVKKQCFDNPLIEHLSILYLNLKINASRTLLQPMKLY